ncbi:MAG: enoyl-CoA hydratase/isomerase family protein [Desulfococcaceae bacterium]
MSKVIREHLGNIALLRMNSGVTNAIGTDLVNDLCAALHEIRKESAGMVLAGGEKFFSMGLNLPELLMMNRKEMTDFWYKFDQLVMDLFTFSLPSVCAIRGHAVAGGCVFALTSDYRFATSDKKQIGLNEIRLGVPVPYSVDMILRQIVGDRAATEMMYTGNFMTLSDAKNIGLVDEICPPESVEDRAVEKAALLASSSRAAFSEMKASRVEEIRIRYEKNAKAKNEIFLDCWFDKAVQEVLKEASRKF